VVIKSKQNERTQQYINVRSVLEEDSLLAMSYNQENQWKGCSSQLSLEISCRKGIFKSYQQ
jgi:hypothetical protein